MYIRSAVVPDTWYLVNFGAAHGQQYIRPPTVHIRLLLYL